MRDGYALAILVLVFLVVTKPDCNCTPCNAAQGMQVRNAADPEAQYFYDPGTVVASPALPGSNVPPQQVVGPAATKSGGMPPACVSLPQSLCSGSCVWCHKTRLCKSRLF